MAHGGCGRATAEDMNLEWFHRVGMVNGSFSSWRGLGEQASWGRPAQGVVSPRELSRSEAYGREQVQGRSS